MSKRKSSDNQHTVDMLFVITLFCVFAVCASLLIALGANIYKSTIDSMEDHYTLPTALSFVTEKVHQHDTSDSVSIVTYGDGSALLLKEEYGSATYYDYIYCYDGYLRELFVADGVNLSPDAGEKLMAVSSWDIDMADSGLLHVSIGDHKDNVIDSSIYVHSR